MMSLRDTHTFSEIMRAKKSDLWDKVHAALLKERFPTILAGV
jgi:hypothetical protein